MLLGYARVSKTADQDTAAQVGTLKAAGCTRIYEERASGGRWDRPELHRLLDHLRAGDALVVWKLDRLSRSLKDLLHILEKIDAAGANFRSLTEAIDTSGPAGRMMMQMLGCFAEFERAMVRERTRAGLKTAREQGRIGGRRPTLMPHQRTEISACSPLDAAAPMSPASFASTAPPSGASPLRREPYRTLRLSPSRDTRHLSIHPVQNCVAKRKKLNLQLYHNVIRQLGHNLLK
jgi:DNA invertase Pin-like site-specific DNA recombinase